MEGGYAKRQFCFGKSATLPGSQNRSLCDQDISTLWETTVVAEQAVSFPRLSEGTILAAAMAAEIQLPLQL